MAMEPLDPAVSPMYLVNIGDAALNNAYLSADHSWLMSPFWSLSTGLAFDVSDRSLHDPVAAELLTIEFPDASTDRLVAAAGWKAGLQYRSNEAWGLSLNLSGGSRLPSHTETYGYYIYSPVDNLFYFGNPGLKNEKSTQLSLSGFLNGDNRRYGVEASLFLNHMRDYIGGLATDALFAAWTNYSAALHTGGEAAGYVQLSRALTFDLGMAYVFAQNLELGEPLPMIPPFEVRAGIDWQWKLGTVSAQIRHAAAQHRIASVSTLETGSRAFTLIDLRASWIIRRDVELRAGIENLTDIRYSEHSGPGKFPSPGRSVQVQILVKI
jgi:iron complex outermembrane recepter protein